MIGPHAATIRALADRGPGRAAASSATRPAGSGSASSTRRARPSSESTVRRYVRACRRELELDRATSRSSPTTSRARRPRSTSASPTCSSAASARRSRSSSCACRHSGAAVHVAFGSEGQEAFLEGHVIAFARLGGVPARIRYDNARALVARVLRGRDRIETERFIALRSHYGFDSFFCEPGEQGAHEKGGIEGEVGRLRRRFFVPVPRVRSLAELNELLEVADRARPRPPHRRPAGDRRRHGRGRPGGPAAAARGALRLRAGHPGPGRPQGPGVRPPVLVLGPGAVCRAGRLIARIGGTRIEVTDGGTVVAAHERSLTRAARRWCSTTTSRSSRASRAPCRARSRPRQARRAGRAHRRPRGFWTRARRKFGDAAARGRSSRCCCSTGGCRSSRSTRRSTRRTGSGSADPALVAIEARRIAEGRGPTGSTVDRGRAPAAGSTATPRCSRSTTACSRGPAR